MGTPIADWMVYNGKSYKNGWLRGTPISGNLEYVSWWGSLEGRPKARIWQWYSLAIEVAAGALARQPTGPEDQHDVSLVSPRAPLEPKGFQSPWELAEIKKGCSAL